MATHVTPGYAPVEEGAIVRATRRISWGAIFAGVVIAVAVQLVMGILGTGIGLSMVDPVQGSTPGAAGFGIGAGLYWLITTVVALGAGGYAAARVSGVTEKFDALVHGLVVWGVTLLLTLYLLTSAVGGIIGGAFRTVGAVAGAAGSTVGAAAPKVAQVAGVDQNDVQAEAAKYLTETPADPAQMTPEQAQKEVAKQLPAMARGGADGARAEARVVDIVAAQRKISRDQAQAQVNQAKAEFVQTKNEAVAKAKQAADAAAGAGAKTSFILVLALLVGAGASAFGATAASRRRLR
ncbi:hypothetical protein KV697_11640 [Sphingomonas sanguinis]|uniref:PhnA-like protein n=1 Tax=Sphingomonas sanguinis TaxID=33051 RepID=A0ABU5LS61_9SPHN|nr:hypothetical protein [Sphingomonas sanguinis]MDZ7282774.1 hypothetical protein [Sphingomonas sanguinis]QXT34473.1 hypothetical protein KV697_11640 [Sphingomonas sanguinis]